MVFKRRNHRLAGRSDVEVRLGTKSGGFQFCGLSNWVESGVFKPDRQQRRRSKLGKVQVILVLTEHFLLLEDPVQLAHVCFSSCNLSVPSFCVLHPLWPLFSSLKVSGTFLW